MIADQTNIETTAEEEAATNATNETVAAEAATQAPIAEAPTAEAPAEPEEVRVPRVVDRTQVAVQFDHVTKKYKLYKNDRRRFLGLFTDKVPYKPIYANNDLSFTIHKGESVAFLGSNGAGKSTALKIITGVIYPTKGTCTVNGRVSALLELKAGFSAALTGRENIYYRGQLWGMTNEEIKAAEPGIIEFAALGDYIDQPLKTYSSGMKSRLGFAFASNINPEILVVDEALSVGDKKFKKKCRERVNDIVSHDGVTVLFVTHSTGAARDFCERGIVIDHGKLLFDGPIDDAIEFYENQD